MKKERFNIKFKEKIIKGTAKLFYNDLPVRIICWDRNRVGYPIVGLMKTSSELNPTGPDIILEITEDGKVFVPSNRVQHDDDKLYIHYESLPTRLMRVNYAVMKLPTPEALFDKFGFVENEERSWYENTCDFVVKIVPTYLVEIHNYLKEHNRWPYDDDEDWNFDFKDNEIVICIKENKLYPFFKKGVKYTVQYVDTIHTYARVDDINVDFLDCIDMFEHIPTAAPVMKTNENKYSKYKFDFKELKPFTKVLVRTGENKTWHPHFFREYHPEHIVNPFYVIESNAGYPQCVPYEGNESLANTQKPIPEFFKVGAIVNYE